MDLVITSLPVQLTTGERVESVDAEGGAPLRCCLRDSRAGERIALVSVAPLGPAGAYLEWGPVFVHADPCAGPESGGYPEEWRSRRQVFRAYGLAGSIVGGELVEPGGAHEDVARRLFTDPEVAFVHSRNLIYGCYLLRIDRAG